jgi:hypothetical protein
LLDFTTNKPKETMKYILIISILLTGCGSSPGDSSKVETGRFTSEYQGRFGCGSGDREYERAIYIIKDTVTGVEYLAVQGCGTSQLVREQQGKITHDIER